jgi:hypothetical protein
MGRRQDDPQSSGVSEGYPQIIEGQNLGSFQWLEWKNGEMLVQEYNVKYKHMIFFVTTFILFT